MDIWYLEWKCSSKSSVSASSEKTKAVCFVEAAPADFLKSLELDELFSRDVRLVPDFTEKWVFFDTATRKFWKYFDSIDADEFPAYAMKESLKNGNVFRKIDWKCHLLSQKEMLQRMFKRLANDIKTKSEQDFLKLYN